MRKTGSSKRRAIVTATALSTLLVATASMAGSRILGTGAVSAIEGAAGGRSLPPGPCCRAPQATMKSA